MLKHSLAKSNYLPFPCSSCKYEEISPRLLEDYASSQIKVRWLSLKITIIQTIVIKYLGVQFSSVQFSHSVMSDSLQTHKSQHIQVSLSITNSQSLLKLMSIESVMPSNHLILCRPPLLLPPTPPSIKVFSSESVRSANSEKDHLQHVTL